MTPEKEKLATARHRYYVAHKEERIEYQRRYDGANKLKCAGDQIVIRTSERHDCPSYQDCLTAAAIKNIWVVPCLGCQKGARAFNAKEGPCES